MGTFKIEGGKALKGEITPQGAKNEALQVLCPVLLTSEKVRVTNIPDIIDVNKLITIGGIGLSAVGAFLSSVANDKKMEKAVEKKVEEALNARKEEET